MSSGSSYQRLTIPAISLLLIGFTVVYVFTIHYYNNQIIESNEKIESYKRINESLMRENLFLRNEISKLREEIQGLNLTIKSMLENYTMLQLKMEQLNSSLKSVERERDSLTEKVSYLEKIVKLDCKRVLFNQTLEPKDTEYYVFRIEYAGYLVIHLKSLSSGFTDIPKLKINFTNTFVHHTEGVIKVYENVFEVTGFTFERSLILPVLPGLLNVSMMLLSGELVFSLIIIYVY